MAGLGFYIGQIKAVKEKERKIDGKTENYTDVFITLEVEDKEGNIDGIAEHLSFPSSEYKRLRDLRGKYALIPFIIISTKNGTYNILNEDIEIVVYDKSSLESGTKKVV